MAAAYLAIITWRPAGGSAGRALFPHENVGAPGVRHGSGRPEPALGKVPIAPFGFLRGLSVRAFERCCSSIAGPLTRLTGGCRRAGTVEVCLPLSLLPRKRKVPVALLGRGGPVLPGGDVVVLRHASASGPIGCTPTVPPRAVAAQPRPTSCARGRSGLTDEAPDPFRSASRVDQPRRADASCGSVIRAATSGPEPRRGDRRLRDAARAWAIDDRCVESGRAVPTFVAAVRWLPRLGSGLGVLPGALGASALGYRRPFADAAVASRFDSAWRATTTCNGPLQVARARAPKGVDPRCRRRRCPPAVGAGVPGAGAAIAGSPRWGSSASASPERPWLAG
jgi:hypothetical protein